MKHLVKFITLLLLFSTQLVAIGSSAISIKRNTFILGKNFDAISSEGMIIKNLKGVEKTSYGLDTRNTVKWSSKYGSVTFNQMGKEFPLGGMNENGLTIEMLWNEDAYYPENNNPSLSEYEWVQYNLDNFKTAAEVLFYIDSLSINPLNSKVHYIIADRGGRGFVVDFINGKTVVSKTGDKFQVVTNSNYSKTANYYLSHLNDFDKKGQNSNDRFCQLSSKANQKRSNIAEGIFDILAESEVDQESYKTQWTIVYDIYKYEIHFKSRLNKEVKIISLKTLDFNSNYIPVAMNVNTKHIEWENFNSNWNKKILTLYLIHNNVKLDLEQVNEHMMNPKSMVMDNFYAKNYKDLKVKFQTKNSNGKIIYILTKGKENYKKLIEIDSGALNPVNEFTEKNFYSISIGEYALVAKHDKKDEAIIPVFYTSKNSNLPNATKKLFKLPKYKKVKFDLNTTSNFELKVK